MRDGEGGVDNDRSDEVGEQVFDEYSVSGASQCAGGFDEGLVFEREDLSSDDTRHGEPGDASDRDEEGHDIERGACSC